MIHMCILWFSTSCSVPQRQYSVCFWPFLQFSSGAHCHFWLCCVLSACVLIMQDSLRILYSVVFLFWLLCVSNFWVFFEFCVGVSRLICAHFWLNALSSNRFLSSSSCLVLFSVALRLWLFLSRIPCFFFFFCCYCQSLHWKKLFCNAAPPPKKIKKYGWTPARSGPFRDHGLRLWSQPPSEHRKP